MPTLNSKYKSPFEIRNNPTEQDEKDYADMEAGIEAEKIIRKFERERGFLKNMTVQLAKRVLDIKDTDNADLQN